MSRTKEIRVFMSDDLRDIITRDCHFTGVAKNIGSTYHKDRPFEGRLIVNLPEKKRVVGANELKSWLLNTYGISGLQDKYVDKFLDTREES